MTVRALLATALLLLAPCASRAAAPSPGTALALSLLGTAAPAATALAVRDHHSATAVTLGVASVVLGPATGYWYGGHAARGWSGAAWRAGTIGATTGLLLVITPDDGFDGIDDQLAAAVTIVSLGAATLAVLTVTDLALVHSTVAAGRPVAVSLAPAAVGGAPGVRLTARF